MVLLHTLPSGQVVPSLKLNIGCGFALMEGYTNIDLQAFHKPDIVGDARDLPTLPSGVFEEVQARDVLEHFRWSETPLALYEWNRLLRDGGRLYLTTTYLPGLLRRYDTGGVRTLADHKLWIVNLFSMQKYEGDFHLTAFSERLLRYYLWQCGFEVESLAIRDGWLFQVWARKVVDHAYPAAVTAPTTDEEFVREAYRLVHHREGDGGGVASWTQRLADGVCTRAGLIKQFLVSEEHEERMSGEAPDFALTVDPY